MRQSTTGWLRPAPERRVGKILESPSLSAGPSTLKGNSMRTRPTERHVEREVSHHRLAPAGCIATALRRTLPQELGQPCK